MFKYKKLKSFLEKDFCDFIVDYFILKTNAKIESSEDKNNFLYYFEYADALMETILHNSQESVIEIVGEKLFPSYTYSGIYTLGDEVCNHKNKKTEKIEGFLFLGSDEGKETITLSEFDDCSNKFSEELEPGDLFLFNGHNYWHWIEPLQSKWSIRSFLYFTDDETLSCDERPYLGFKK